MGKVIVQADMIEMSELIRNWCGQADYQLSSSSKNILVGDETRCLVREFTAMSRFSKATWRFCHNDEGVLITFCDGHNWLQKTLEFDRNRIDRIYNGLIV